VLWAHRMASVLVLAACIAAEVSAAAEGRRLGLPLIRLGSAHQANHTPPFLGTRQPPIFTSAMEQRRSLAPKNYFEEYYSYPWHNPLGSDPDLWVTMPDGCTTGCTNSRKCFRGCCDSCCQCTPGYCRASREIIECMGRRNFTLDHLTLAGTLYNARTVNLEGSNISYLNGESTISKLSALEYLSLKDTNLMQMDRNALANKSLLKSLDISHNDNLEDLEEGIFAELIALEYLNIPKHQVHRLCLFGLNAFNSSAWSELSQSYTTVVYVDGLEHPDVPCHCHYDNFTKVGLCERGGRDISAAIKLEAAIICVLASIAVFFHNCSPFLLSTT